LQFAESMEGKEIVPFQDSPNNVQGTVPTPNSALSLEFYQAILSTYPVNVTTLPPPGIFEILGIDRGSERVSQSTYPN
ncbi:hypothetical protein PENTCL1PPCAC_2467, partial [Pristionchus entomophagus]